MLFAESFVLSSMAENIFYPILRLTDCPVGLPQSCHKKLLFIKLFHLVQELLLNDPLYIEPNLPLCFNLLSVLHLAGQLLPCEMKLILPLHQVGGPLLHHSDRLPVPFSCLLPQVLESSDSSFLYSVPYFFRGMLHELLFLNDKTQDLSACSPVEA